MSALEAVSLVFDILFKVASLSLTFLLYYMLYQMWTHYARPLAYKGGPKLTAMCLVRRLWCQHRNVARVKDPSNGRNYTACTYCALDVNQGKPQEEWR